MATFNGAPWIGQQLEALCQQRGPVFEIVVADNGSLDRTPEIVSRFQARVPQLTMIDASALSGQCFARNQGAAAASGEQLLFVDQDDVVAPGYVEAMSVALDEFDVVGARIDRDTLNEAWAVASRWPAQTHALGDALGFLPYVGGQTMGIRKTLFDEIGGFDLAMPGAVEDVDLCWRAQRHGGRIGYVPGAVLQYRYRPSLRAQAGQAFSYGRAEVVLYCHYRSLGMRRRSRSEVLKKWAMFARRCLRARSRGDIARLIWILMHSVGMVVQDVQSRCIYF